MHIGTRVMSKQKPYRDGTVIKTLGAELRVRWDKSSGDEWVQPSSVSIIGFDPKFDSGVGVIRDGQEVWKRVIIEQQSA